MNKYKALSVPDGAIYKQDAQDEKIIQELQKYQPFFVIDFFRIFQSPNIRGTCFIRNKEMDLYVSQIVWLQYDSSEIFWCNWNKYLKMKAFI